MNIIYTWSALITYTLILIIGKTKIDFDILYVQEVVTPFYRVSYYIKWVTTSWTYSINISM